LAADLVAQVAVIVAIARRHRRKRQGGDLEIPSCLPWIGCRQFGLVTSSIGRGERDGHQLHQQ